MVMRFVKSDDVVVFSTETLEEEENIKAMLEEEELFESLDYRNVEWNPDYWLI